MITDKRHLFWDVVIEKLDKDTNSFFMIERILEYGDIDDWQWLKENYTAEQIADVAEKSRTKRLLRHGRSGTSPYIEKLAVRPN